MKGIKTQTQSITLLEILINANLQHIAHSIEPLQSTFW